MRWIVVACLLWRGLGASADDWRVEGFVDLRGGDASGPVSWLEGGPGRLPAGDDRGEAFWGQVQAAATWEPSLYFSAYVHGLARLEPDEYGGDASGLVEAYLEGRIFVGQDSGFRLRFGSFFPQTSMENVNALWESPYTIHFSALNSWIAEEVRWNGLDVRYRGAVNSEQAWFIGATALTGNDAIGAMLAWRGWSASDRLTVWNEILPLPALSSLANGGIFSPQRDDGTKPFGGDLDGRLGYAGRVGYEVVDRFRIQANGYDNRADRGLHDGEYAWETDFLSAGFEWFPGGGWSLAGEWIDGSTGMGFERGPHVQLDFEAWHALVSHEWRGWRWTARYEEFETVDIDSVRVDFNPDRNQEDGEALTLALFWAAGQWRFGLERLDFEVVRPVALATGLDVVRGGEMWTVSARRYF